MAIPDEPLRRGIEKISGCKFFGHPVENMTRDELLSLCGHLLAKLERVESEQRIASVLDDFKKKVDGMFGKDFLK